MTKHSCMYISEISIKNRIQSNAVIQARISQIEISHFPSSWVDASIYMNINYRETPSKQ